jgi:osmotically-inducible protein OsmY
MATKPGRYGATSHRGGEREPRAEDDGRMSGPGGATRPDDRIREDIRGHLIGDPRLDAADIEVKVEDGEVTLSGAVVDQPQRQRAQELAQGVSGVRNVRNALRIRLHGVGTTGNSTPS